MLLRDYYYVKRAREWEGAERNDPLPLHVLADEAFDVPGDVGLDLQVVVQVHLTRRVWLGNPGKRRRANAKVSR